MKTTIDIPEKELKEVVAITGAATKKEAILEAVRDYNRRARLNEIASKLGTFKNFMTQKELQAMRDDA